MGEKELTDAEKSEQARASNVKKTLDAKLIQDTLATNTILSNQNLYGSENVERAQNYYNALTSGEDFNKEINADYQKTVDAYKKMGIFGEPSRPSNADVSAKLVQQFNEITQIATLEELLTGAKNAVKKAGAKIEEELPQELKNYTYTDLIKLAGEKGAISKDGKISIDKLGKNEQNAFKMYSALVGVYKEACIQRVCSPFGEYNQAIKEICDSYNPKSQEKSDK
jgi:hypothetical protein